MKKFIALLLCMLTLFAFSACSTPLYPGLPDISEDPMKGVEIYCWQDGGEWKCGGTVGTNRHPKKDTFPYLVFVSCYYTIYARKTQDYKEKNTEKIQKNCKKKGTIP